MTIFLTALVVWGLSGVIIAWVASRHGHNFWLFAAMGLGYGPLLVLIWLRGARGQATGARLVNTEAQHVGNGWIDVLVGLDGTEAAVKSTAEVLTKLGPAVQRVRLTSVLDHELSNSPDLFLSDERRIDHLREAAVELGFPNAEISLTSGQPDKALRDHATDNNFDLIVIAHRRDTLVSGLRGSTASRLARTADLPILIGPPAS